MGRFGAIEFEDLEAVGPGTPGGRYWRLFWQPVARLMDVAPGRARPVEILGEHFTVYRADDGTPHVTDHRCPHRGTPLSLGWVEGDTLRCRYHGWRFDGAGRCVEQPNEDRPFCGRVRVKSYPTEAYAGLIFAYLGEGAAPPLPRYPDLDKPGVLVTDPPEVLPCTFWNKFDNDHGHRAWVHRATALRKNRGDILVIRDEAVEETDYGWCGRRAVKGDGSAADTSLGKAAGQQAAAQTALGGARRTHWFMPNVRLFFQPTRARGFQGTGVWDTKLAFTVPVNDAKHVAFDVTLTPLTGKEAEAYAAVRAEQEAEDDIRWDLAEKILAGEMTLEDLPDDMSAYTSFTIEDYVTQVGQGPIRGRGDEHLAASEQRLVLLRQLWLREVNAMVGGRPLKSWRMPAEPLLAGSTAQ